MADASQRNKKKHTQPLKQHRCGAVGRRRVFLVPGSTRADTHPVLSCRSVEQPGDRLHLNEQRCAGD
ncbi:hypothetical protein JOB18_035095 [Solea senegalensis]|uniref:Uncharacterized protein n=1 Tax=Solea senegalensis TaxID=28829 RepID=A0AAV6QYL7_SOLSE|nr:hypothetical protein JOB18_035095 [Solea senegalensis]